MANDYISQVTLPNNTTYDLRDDDAVRGNARVFYGTCDTAAGTTLKEVICAQYDKVLTNGDMFIVKFSITNTGGVGSLQLTIKNSTEDTAGTTAKNIKRQYNGTGASNLASTAELNKDSIAVFIYNGTYWILTNADYNSTYSYMRPYESTAKGSYSSANLNPAKTGAGGWRFQLSAGQYFMYSHYYDNQAQSALTLNIGGTGAKPIYINGTASSSSNYTLPGGQYLVYYDGTNYHFRTDDKMPGNIAGNATTATTTTYIKSSDTRNAALNPSDLTASTSAVRFDFKSKTAIGLTATDVYAGVMSFRPYGTNTDWTGGNAHQIAFNSEGLHWRNGGASWGDWIDLLDANNYSSYALPLSGGTMSGHIFMGGSNASSSTANTTQLVFGTSATQHIAVTSNDKALILNPSTGSTTNQIVLYLNKKSKFPSGIEGDVTGDLTGNADTATTATNLSAAPSITSGGTATVTLSANTAYTLTVGGKSVIFKTPADGNTDTKVNVTAAASAISHNYILMTATAPTTTPTGHTALGASSLWVNSADKGKFELVLGNSTATSTTGGQYGQLALYSASTAGTYLKAADGTAWKTQTLQAKDGTIALTSDIPTWSSLGGGDSGKHADSYFIKAITSTDNAIVRFDSTSGQVQDSTATINDTGTMTIKGKLIVNPSYDTSNSYNEGIRINQASNGWANIHFGGAKDTTSGNADGAWLVGRRGAVGTYGAVGDFTIEEQGSSGLGLTVHQDRAGATLYVSKTSGDGLKIMNGGTVAANTSFIPIRAMTANMAAASWTLINIGRSADSKNSATFGFYYAGNASNSNYVTIGLHSVDNLLKIFATGQTNITKNISSTSVSSGSLVVAGGAGIGEKLYVANDVHAEKYIVNENVTLQWNSTDSSLDFVFA